VNLPGAELTASDLGKLARSAITPKLARQAYLRRVTSTEGVALVGRNGADEYSAFSGSVKKRKPTRSA
jgi:hypothetical protein